MKPTIYRCRSCYNKLLKTVDDEEKARSQAEFTMRDTPKAAKTVQCPKCQSTNIEIVNFVPK